MEHILGLQRLDGADDANDIGETETVYSTSSHTHCMFANADGYEG